MTRFRKDLICKIIGICLCCCVFADTSLNAAPNLRSKLMFEKDNHNNELRFKTLAMRKSRESTSKQAESSEVIQRSDTLLKKVQWWKRNLGPEQKKAALKVIKIYNIVYKLNLNEEKIQNIITNRILLIKHSQTPLRFYLSLWWIYYAFAALMNIYYLTFAPDYSSYFLRSLFYSALVAGMGYIMKHDRYEEAAAYTRPIKMRIFLSFESYKEDRNDIEFLQHLSHESAHFFRLPNHCLLAEAYAFLVSYSLDNQYVNGFIDVAKTIGQRHVLEAWEKKNKYEVFSPTLFVLSEEALKTIQDPVIREVVVRKILSRKTLMHRFRECSNRSQIHRLVEEVSANIGERDYRIPHLKSDGFNKWAYLYGEVMGYIAIQSCYDTESAFQYIYRLGQLRDARDLKKIIESIDLRDEGRRESVFPRPIRTAPAIGATERSIEMIENQKLGRTKL